MISSKEEKQAILKDLEESRKANQSLQEQNTKLREVVLNNISEAEQIEDATIIGMFVNLREEVQRIVTKFYAVNRKPRLAKELSEQQLVFFGGLKKLNDRELRNRARERLFLFLRQILCKPCFGAADDLEAGLVRIETSLKTLPPGET